MAEPPAFDLINVARWNLYRRPDSRGRRPSSDNQ